MDLFEKSDFETALKVIRDHVIRTPMEHSRYLSELNGGRVYIKCENEQTTGSFKLRGACYTILTLKNIYNTFVTASSGNHGLACSLAFSQTDTTGIIFLPSGIQKSKLSKLKSTGAKLMFVDGDAVVVEEAARKYADEHRVKYISPYNDINIIRGQGTCGVEILEQCPKVDYVFVTVGGGGLASGVLCAIKAAKPGVKVVGCQPSKSPVMKVSVDAGKIVEYESGPTLSDGSAGGVEIGSMTFDICRVGIDQWVTVDEDEIRNAIRVAYKYQKQKVIEGAAGVAIAAYIKMAPELKGKCCVVVSCGGNIDSTMHSSIVQ